MVAKFKVPETWYNYTYAYPSGYCEDGIDLTDTVFYVGKGKNGRIDEHEKEAARGCNCRKCQEIRKVWASGKPVQKRIVFETLAEEAAFENEKTLIAQHASIYLTNILSNPDGTRKQNEYLLIGDIAGYLMISERTVYHLVKSGKLKGFKVGREWRFGESDMEDFIQKQMEKA